MELLNLSEYEPLKTSVIITAKNTHEYQIEKIIAVSKNKIAFRDNICKSMGLDGVVHEPHYEANRGLVYTLKHKTWNKILKIYHFDDHNSVEIDLWEVQTLHIKKLCIGDPKDIPMFPNNFPSVSPSLSLLKYIDYAMIDVRNPNCPVKKYVLTNIFEDIGT